MRMFFSVSVRESYSVFLIVEECIYIREIRHDDKDDRRLRTMGTRNKRTTMHKWKPFLFLLFIVDISRVRERVCVCVCVRKEGIHHGHPRITHLGLFRAVQ